MNVMRDLTSVVLSSEQVTLGSVAEVRRMVREADQPELAAAYDRIEELTALLRRAKEFIEDNCIDWDFDGGAELADDIHDAVDQHAVLS